MYPTARNFGLQEEWAAVTFSIHTPYKGILFFVKKYRNPPGRKTTN